MSISEAETHPVGYHIAHYLRHRRTNLAWRTYLDYEKTLHTFAVEQYPRTIDDFAPPAGADLIEEWIAEGWGQTRPGTRLKIIAALAGFFDWAYKRSRIAADPMPLIARPRRNSVPRQAHPIKRVLALIEAQPLSRNRCALRLLGQVGLRKNELRLLQIRDFDLERIGGTVRVRQKGGDIVDQPIYFPPVLRELADHFETEKRGPDEYLLYPRWERTLKDGIVVVQREKRDQPLSARGLHEWWVRCLERAQIPHFPMHEMRHSAGTEFHRAVHDLELTRQFMRHKSIQTTSSVYMHLDHEDMAAALAKVAERWEEPAPQPE